MTEATNRPTLPVPPGPADDSAASYSSVSYWAIGGFILAVAYATVMAVGVVIALLNRTPWILPTWTLVFPLGAIFVCWAARVRIRNSEGSLTGTALTVWGVWLSLSFGLVYGAYYSACYLSVTQMATNFVDGWFDDLKKDQLDVAFLKTLPPPRPAADAHLRELLELNNDRGPEGKGAFTDFRQSQIVRQVEQGGNADQIQFLGVQSWGYDQGYQVQLLYRITTPAMVSEAVATAVGLDNVDDSGVRQWYIKFIHPNGPPVLTDEGRRMTEWTDQAKTFAEDWLADVSQWNWDKAYLDTLPPGERKEQKAAHEKPAAERNKSEQELERKYQAGMKAFREGDIVRPDPNTFWASPKEKDKIIDGVRGVFGKGKDADGLDLKTAAPIYHRDADQVTFRFDLMIPLPPYGIQSLLVVTADVHNGEPAPDDWRIESLDLFSGKKATAGEPGPGGMSARTPRRPH